MVLLELLVPGSLEVLRKPEEKTKQEWRCDMNVEKKVIKKTPFHKIDHITIVTNDLERTVDFYTSLGIGPFLPPTDHVFAYRTLRGKPFEGKNIGVEARMGGVVLQVVQVIEGESLAKEYLQDKGEGVQALGFEVENVDKAESRLVKLGLKVTQRGRREDGSGYSYFDTEQLGCVALEIKQYPAKSQ
jgi:catechol 2,3-dioxygenase-like lactoylglutathione lyase family enzyme